MRALALLALLLATPAFAQTGSLEDRMRGELRATKTALAAAEAKNAPLEVRAAAAEKERDRLKTELAKAKPAARVTPVADAADKRRIAALEADVAAANARAAAAGGSVARAAAAVKAQRDADVAALTQMKNERDQALAAAKTAVDATAGQQGALAAARAKNARLYAIAKDILNRYERVGFGDVLASREPFLGLTRVRLQNEAEKLGDQAYAERVDATQPPPPANPAPKK